MRQLAALAVRYDERLDMALNQKEQDVDGNNISKIDAYQVELVCRLFRQDEALARQEYIKRELHSKTFVNLQEESVASS